MTYTAGYLAIGLAAMVSVSTARAETVDFARFLASPAGAAGIAAAVAGLGQCDTPLSWSQGFNPSNGDPDPDSLMVACQYQDLDDEEFYDKSVVARFQFWDGMPVLQELTYLP
ncbi:hypothetical protein [uncultured Hoeflea sp.]|uniref:hypothetical protein n=1 Tax=uncultured Hoeflea sp. TaxID=538666 RepID=UPI0030EBF3AD|tara:strand:+ start:27439 stop:27777 length:339 start_codon:yes stop_codon:yes gene_type:complete